MSIENHYIIIPANLASQFWTTQLCCLCSLTA